jgi:hypothetical protein
MFHNFLQKLAESGFDFFIAIRVPSLLTFDANDLFQFRDDFDQIGLVTHNLVNVFVCAGNFVNYAGVFAAFNAACLAFQILAREAFFCRRARHLATCAV